MGTNRVILTGRLTRDPEVRALSSGKSVCNLSVVTNERYQDGAGQWQERKEFHNVVIYGKRADTCGERLRKGSAIGVEGRLTTRSWEKNGEKRYRTEIVAEETHWVTLADDAGVASAGGAAPAQHDDEDIPF